MGSKAAIWKFIDPTMTGIASTYEFDVNPNAMTSPFPERNIAVRSSTALDGKPLLFEGPTAPVEWSFSGNCLTAVQYDALRFWVYDKLGHRVIVEDHFARRIECVLKKFDPTPRRDIHRYWHHTYTINALVVKVGRPQNMEVWK